jgi:hypothetical protein
VGGEAEEGEREGWTAEGEEEGAGLEETGDDTTEERGDATGTVPVCTTGADGVGGETEAIAARYRKATGVGGVRASGQEGLGRKEERLYV